MTDGIVKGTGNSRYLKAPPDILSKYPTWEAAAAAFAAGTFAVDFNGINAAGWTTQGTALNKANLLTDTLCTNLGLATTATPTQAMEKLKTLADSKSEIEIGSYTGTGSISRTLSFSIEPKIVIVYWPSYGYGLIPASSKAAWRNSFIWVGQSYSQVEHSEVGVVSFNYYSANKQLLWSCVTTSLANSEKHYVALNYSGETYKYISIS